MDNILQFYINQGIISFDDVVVRGKDIMKHTLDQVHKYALTFNETRNRWETYIPDALSNSGRKKVVRKEKEELIKLLLVKYAEMRSMTFYDLWPEFMNDKAMFVKGNTVKRLISDYRRFYHNTDFAHINLSKLTAEDLQKFFEQTIQEYGLTKKAFSNFSGLFHQFIEWALDQKYISFDPFQRLNKKRLKSLLKEPEIKDAEKLVFYQDEIRKMTISCNEALHKTVDIRPAAVILTCVLGMRIGETVALKWDDIDWRSMQIRIRRHELYYGEPAEDFRSTGAQKYCIEERTKGKRGSVGYRDVPLVDSAINLLNNLRNYYDENGIKSEWIFVENGRRIHYYVVEEAFKTYCRRAGIPFRSPHKARATYVSMLHDLGIDWDTIRRWVGHTDVRTTQQSYYHSTTPVNESRQILEKAFTLNKQTDGYKQ